MRLHGRVTRSGQAVEGAYVRLIGPSGDFTAEVRTDDSGRFVFYPMAGAWEVRVSMPGGPRLEKSVTIADGQSIDLQVSAEDGVTTEVQPATEG